MRSGCSAASRWGRGCFPGRCQTSFRKSWLVAPNLALIMLPLVVRLLPIGLTDAKWRFFITGKAFGGLLCLFTAR
jgi:hypothetical protein